MDDLFSLGMVIYETKTGQIAYAGKDDREIRKLLKDRKFPELAHLPPAWRNVIGKCWREEYNHAEQILIDLNRLSHPDAKCRVIPPLPPFVATLINLRFHSSGRHHRALALVTEK